MRDVAERAGVGLVTVSRVVNGAGSVSEKTAKHVQAVIDELGFQRDEIARSLRPGQSSRTIGLVLGDLTNPFYATLAKGAVDELKKSGYAVVLSSADEDETAERRAISELLGRRVAGLIMVPGQSDHSFLANANRHTGVPFVFVDRPAKGAKSDVVLFDNEEGGRLAVQHLIAHGHRRIAIIVAPSHYTTGRRRRGYRKALQEAGIPMDETLVATLRHGSVEDAARAARALLALDDPPTAIFSTTNFLTEGVLHAIREKHAEVALVGFDDFRLADMLPTPVTVVSSDAEALGTQAAIALLQRLNGDVGQYRRIVLPVHLIVRGSGEIGPKPAIVAEPEPVEALVTGELSPA
jgi:LacI family transcriptional regulator